ncbi:MAG: hypothetical protein KTR20_03980 [Cellvibrionaceae bacterium]|nr:hypothetical protein [Cellvibrionaceae bacterium]
MVSKTLLEKLDSSCKNITFETSVFNQVQRIISTRMYLGYKPEVESWVTGFGVPAIVDEYSYSSTKDTLYFSMLRKKILQLEPRLSDIKIIKLMHYNDRGHCHIVMKLDDKEVEEQFFF